MGKTRIVMASRTWGAGTLVALVAFQKILKSSQCGVVTSQSSP